ncbi:DUF3048 domain-containing protein [Virgibacillus sp. MG-45]|uniref:DUF3048 domain-containing protein n=1 Tax=Virgibacillus sp. MG-45 TaxID=3102791 RepID=UPI002ED7DE5F
MKKWVSILFVVAITVFALTACSKDDQKAEDNEDRENKVSEKSQAPKDVYPLTGIGTNEKVDQRIVGVMVNNHSNARPQTGLSKADIVFEILAEGKITRFLALFQSEQPEVVGPVRSAREYYFELANGYDALYIYHGAARFVDDMIKTRGIEHLNGAYYDNDGHLFKRESFRKAPHNSYLQFDAVVDVAEEKGYDMKRNYESLPFLTKDEISALEGEQAAHVEIVYSTNPMEIVEYDYDEASGKYNRSNDREQTVELETKEAIQADNVFIIQTHHEIIDDDGRRAVDIESGGEAYLLQKGKLQKLQWENRNGRILPIKDGQPVGFVPGKTWINVIPSSPGLEQSVHVSNE